MIGDLVHGVSILHFNCLAHYLVGHRPINVSINNLSRLLVRLLRRIGGLGGYISYSRFLMSSGYARLLSLSFMLGGARCAALLLLMLDKILAKQARILLLKLVLLR